MVAKPGIWRGFSPLFPTTAQCYFQKQGGTISPPTEPGFTIVKPPSIAKPGDQGVVSRLRNQGFMGDFPSCFLQRRDAVAGNNERKFSPLLQHRFRRGEERGGWVG
ncbi:Uncharacterized protein Adt_11483 [Abeliophyllum distichum]|uniref:Uncharacterized protein n=1 Tax=Abeliophyllum distichum TaxID=126358 RepID=A0ABD1UN14_9LAMI